MLCWMLCAHGGASEMGYYLTSFRNYVFPTLQPITEMPTAPGKNGDIATLSTGFDAWGNDDAPSVFPYPLSYRVLVVGASASAYMATLNALRALSKKKGFLYRQGQDAVPHRALARLERVSATDSVETFNAIELAFEFSIWSDWENNWTDGWRLDTGVLLDTMMILDPPRVVSATLNTSPKTITVTVGGNVAVDDAVITLTAGSAAITAMSLQITAMGVIFDWTGTLASGKALVIDCGAWKVTNDNADAWSGFTFHATHTQEGIMRLAPGANSLIIYVVGGSTNSVIDFGFADRWA